jgi:hypothetical protein
MWRRRWSTGCELLNWFANVRSDTEWVWADSTWCTAEDAIKELARGVFDFYGRELAIDWLDGDEAAEARREHFGDA